MTTPSRPRAAAAGGAGGLLLVAILLYALNLRSPITALAPVVRDVESALGLTAAQVGLLTGLPVLCFAVASPLASTLVRRLGVETVMSGALVTVLVGTLVRSVGGFPSAVAGTIVIGVAIAAGNISVPVVIARDFPGSAARVTGLYTAALNLGSVATTALTAPIAGLVGWRWALVVWAVFVPVAWFPWRAAVRRLGERPDVVRKSAGGHAGAAADERSVLRRPLTWLLVGTFAGQSFGYYGVTAWLPSILEESVHLSGGGSGVAAALFQAFGIVGALAVPAALRRRVPTTAVLTVLCAFWLTLPVGLLVAPSAWVVWVSLAGVAQGGNFTVIFSLVATRTADHHEARTMSTTVQTLGYVVAATAPSVVGAVHTASDSWTTPLLVVLGSLSVMTACGLTATATRRPTAA
ncbi:CynX/NimT family MFS transporter [Luteimicrobium subarcticum]|uniref:CP family cyanate transporter-like MFS transporter n=1 Tax=Luteimicrobium subarcticum TaxID=620910 RepID=A0A2M8WT44_9MICO|nr:MFS transporter [Luteimicrobium subarcticum]PJI94079.1 CP family cyanate transporter-like MFS transporter [Luteimicrobium subarcticum]